MARVAGHLSVEDLEAGFRSARDPTAMRHFQVIWLLAEGQLVLLTAPHVALAAGLSIVLAVLGFNLLGDGLRDVLDPRQAQR